MLGRRGVHANTPTERTVHRLEDGLGRVRMEGSFGAGMLKGCETMDGSRKVGIFDWSSLRDS